MAIGHTITQDEGKNPSFAEPFGGTKAFVSIAGRSVAASRTDDDCLTCCFIRIRLNNEIISFNRSTEYICCYRDIVW